MMISKTTFVAIVSMLMKHIDDKKELLECSGDLPDKCIECIMEETEFWQDLITMLTVITFDRFGVIRDNSTKDMRTMNTSLEFPRATNSKFIC